MKNMDMIRNSGLSKVAGSRVGGMLFPYVRRPIVLQKNVTVTRLELSGTGMGAAGACHLATMLQDNNIISHLVRSTLFLYCIGIYDIFLRTFLTVKSELN
jgi:hypothetical protein